MKKEMSIGETIRKAIKEVSNGLLDLIGPKDFKLTDDEYPFNTEFGGNKTMKEMDKIDKENLNGMTPVKPKRARTKSGRYKGDDKSTPNVNEAYIGGKAPKDLLGLKKKKKKGK